MTIILVGKTASGKSTTAKMLENDGYRRIVTDTTRPMREGEIDGVDYNFRTQKEFDRKRAEGYYAETVNYNAAFGFCSYGSAKHEYESDGKAVIVLNPYGLKMVKEKIKPGKSISVFIDVPENVLRDRLFKRGDELAEIDRRLTHDNVDFADMQTVCDYTIHVTTQDENELYEEIKRIIKKEATQP